MFFTKHRTRWKYNRRIIKNRYTSWFNSNNMSPIRSWLTYQDMTKPNYINIVITKHGEYKFIDCSTLLFDYISPNMVFCEEMSIMSWLVLVIYFSIYIWTSCRQSNVITTNQQNWKSLVFQVERFVFSRFCTLIYEYLSVFYSRKIQILIIKK